MQRIKRFHHRNHFALIPKRFTHLVEGHSTFHGIVIDKDVVSFGDRFRIEDKLIPVPP